MFRLQQSARKLRTSFAWLSLFSMLFNSLGGVFFVNAVLAVEGEVVVEEVVVEEPVVEESVEPVPVSQPPVEEP
ncbi:hypothetical protein MUP65_00940, partial [Patescibacteria group bacterium]|nr:hypothetical protein [Patescibacteria group bacterium]